MNSEVQDWDRSTVIELRLLDYCFCYTLDGYSFLKYFLNARYVTGTDEL